MNNPLNKVSPDQLQALRMRNLGVWCALNKFEVDRRPFTFANRKFLKKIYLSTNPFINVRKCTQVGLTIWMVLKVLHRLRFSRYIGRKYAKKAGFYFPVHDTVAKFSKDRLQPIIENIPEFNEVMKGSGSIELKQLGESSLYMSYMGGTASKDSVPLDIICLDETRLMDVKEINQVEERLSGSYEPEMYKISTAGLPNDAIDKAFLQGNQQFWHTNCNCSDGVILSDVFPECIGKRQTKTRPEYFYRCPTCGKDYIDPQDGDYIAHNPNAEIDSFHIHQMLSATYDAKRIWQKYVTSDNPKEFYNACLGKPYVDEENQGIIDDELEGCVNTDLSWKTPSNNTYMGVDQRSGQLHIVIAKWRGEKRNVIHVEVIDSYHDKYKIDGVVVSPFKWLYQRMKEWDVDVCILDALPNANEAKEFAQAFPGRVFLAYYKASGEIARWSDKRQSKKGTESPQLRRSSEEIRFKWVVLLDRYKSIEFTLRQWRRRKVELANPKGLIQDIRDEKTGIYTPSFVVKDVLFKHLKAVARELVNVRTDTNNLQYRWINLGLDPHFLHACNYCFMAMERRKKVFSFEFI